MAKQKTTEGFGVRYPHIDQWVYDEGGWIELGANEDSESFIRVMDDRGTIWEGEVDYPSIDAALKAADAGIAEWFAQIGTDAEPGPKATAKPKKKPAAKRSAEIRLTPVDSSMLQAVGYDEENKELIAVFNSGAMWRYKGVTKKVYKELLAADSQGSYMRSCIIGMYPEYQTRC